MKKCLWFSILMMAGMALALGQVHTSTRVPHGSAGMQQPGPQAMTPPIQFVQEFLGLTADQVKKWEDLQQAKQNQMADLPEQIKKLEEQLQAELKLATPVPATVGELMIKLRNAREEANQVAIAFAGQVRGLLTPEQMKKLETVEECFQLQKITGALVATGFLAPPPPPPRPARPAPPHMP